ncbi:MAG: peptidoglycan DD-metalloendopeptidase family protein [Pigmentiphaga sp.]|nr:peptidoglycan DD-metalloendopeptidase family protein [Pigmentiphaga sp.]
MAACAALLAACGSTLKTVPVVDRTTPSQTPGEASAKADSDYYTVRRGDTLVRIALDNGQDWREIAQWNNLTDPNQIQVGQVLRVKRPDGASAPLASTAPTDNDVVQVTPLPGLSSEQKPSEPTATVPPPPTQPSPAPMTQSRAVEGVTWSWPASGAIVQRFNDTQNKGLDIGGNIGDPILAAADGTVVYSGSGLRGYGQLIILKHNNTYLSAYAHNSKILVKEGQKVRRGDKVAELGQSDTTSPRLHFEIRKQGRPVDPSGFLPQR